MLGVGIEPLPQCKYRITSPTHYPRMGQWLLVYCYGQLLGTLGLSNIGINFPLGLIWCNFHFFTPLAITSDITDSILQPFRHKSNALPTELPWLPLFYPTLIWLYIDPQSEGQLLIIFLVFTYKLALKHHLFFFINRRDLVCWIFNQYILCWILINQYVYAGYLISMFYAGYLISMFMLDI